MFMSLFIFEIKKKLQKSNIGTLKYCLIKKQKKKQKQSSTHVIYDIEKISIEAKKKILK